jgi:formylglycine-generating enzyme required for sulfatase activity
VGDAIWQNLIALATLKGATVPSAHTPTGASYFGTGATFTIDFVTIGNPGNSSDTTGYGAVPYSYQISTYDISQNQINIAAVSGLVGMPTGSWSGDQPSTSISWYQAAAFVNWLNTSKGYAPAYNLSYSNGYSMSLWPTNQAWTLGGTNRYRNAGCCYFLPSENEWYKGAFYAPIKSAGKPGYYLYSQGTDTAPNAVASGTTVSTAVYNGFNAPSSVTQAGGLSPYGTMGQGGNVYQWMETSWSGINTNPDEKRVIRGGGYPYPASDMLSTTRVDYDEKPGNAEPDVGFRVARILP